MNKTVKTPVVAKVFSMRKFLAKASRPVRF